MKKALVGLLFIIFTTTLFAQTPEWQWAIKAGGSYADCGYDLATDSAGNSYVTGHFWNTATFGTIELTSLGYVDVFIAKADSSGNWLWAISAGGTGSLERAYGISIDGAGNSYIIGNFRGTVTFGTTSITSNSIDNSDVFIAKADSGGNWLWAKRCGAYWGNGIATDSDGTCYITGYFSLGSNGDFGSTSFTCRGSYDIFAAKLDTNGNWLWAVQAGGVGEDFAYGISSDNNGNSYITGYFMTSSISHICYFGDIQLLSIGYDFFVAKLDTNGNWLWAVNEGDDNHDYSYEISTNSNGTSFIIGEHYLTSNIGGTIMTHAGTYIASISSSGNWLWAAETDGTFNRYGKNVCADNNGNCYATGGFCGDAYFGPFTLVGGNTGYDTFAAKLDSNGDWVWAVSTGGGSSDMGHGIAVDGLGHCYVTGEYYSTFTCGSYSLPNSGEWDIFVAKLGNDTSVGNEIIPTKMELSNYPNPFNPVTTIKYSLKENSKVTLNIYNIKGQKVKQLVRDYLSVGQHSVIWNGKDDNDKQVSSGIYFYKLNVNGRAKSVKKCLLLK